MRWRSPTGSRGPVAEGQIFSLRSGDGANVILVAADHGQSFYDSEMPGRGRSLDPSEARVPTILWGSCLELRRGGMTRQGSAPQSPENGLRSVVAHLALEPSQGICDSLTDLVCIGDAPCHQFFR